MSSSTPPSPSSDAAPAWELARLFPLQGQWTDEDYFRLPTDRLVELSEGCLEVLPMPTWMHQMIVDFVAGLMRSASAAVGDGARVLQAPLPVTLFAGTIREPDLLYLTPPCFPSSPTDYPSRLDIAVEVVSEGAEARHRDYVAKRSDYARGGVQEYWIIDPFDRTVTVLRLNGDAYDEVGVFRAGETARGSFLPSFEVPVNQVMRLADEVV
ncbi:Uma2 family endonuclease [Stieleria sp. ICT_E10.1]|uniref:Uma2 family endonuclease n=1 Tax=Stieleria sedimenti TaxID=2976331 RepID=UPI00217F5A54|nr:Uma2 family endonuclease [Stieleria sedimenti]MCS7469613.1 Uma2 family endonuclease [Stieleria sedimenti]